MLGRRQIDSLPFENLREIVHLALSATSLDGETSAWITKIMGVCRHWRDLIVNDPLLWTGIDLSGGPDFINLCLARSANAPHINLIYGAPKGPLATQSTARLSKSALRSIFSPHYSRIMHVRLYFQDHTVARRTIPLLKARLPQLSSISIRILWDPSMADSDIPSLHLVARRLPRLRSISLLNVTVDWAGIPISQLTSLELYCITPNDTDDGSLTELLNLLESATSLEHFTYEFDRQASFEDDAAARLVSLPHIRRFSLTGFGEGMAHILSHIHIPSDAQLFLCVDEFDEEDEDDLRLVSSVLPPRSTHLPCLVDARYLLVWVELGNIHIIADTKSTPLWQARPWRHNPEYKWSWPPSIVNGGKTTTVKPEPAFSMTHWGAGEATEDWILDQLLEELAATFPPTVETLVVRGYVSQSSLFDTSRWRDTLGAFPCLRELDIVAEDCDVSRFPRSLYDRSFGMGTDQSPPCPHLRSLFLRFNLYNTAGKQTLRDLCAALKQRADQGLRLEALSLFLEPEPGLPLRLYRVPEGPNDPYFVHQLPGRLRGTQRQLESLVDVFTLQLRIGEQTA